MDIEFGTTELRRLATEPGYTAGYPPEVETMYRRRIQFIDAAPNDLALRNLRTGGERRIVRIVSIEDYH